MKLTIEPIVPERANFGGKVSGVDLRETLSASEVEAIAAAMDRFAVLHFPEQDIDDAQQLAFARQFGSIEATYGVPGDNVQAGRLSNEINDISNLDRNNNVLARDDRHRLYSLGNMLWHSDSSYKSTPAKHSMLSARVIPDRGGNTEFADMRAAWDDLDGETQDAVRNLICEHSRLYSRRDLGFEFSKEEALKFAPVQQRLVRRHPSTGRLSLFLSSHGGTIRGWPLPEARMLLRDLTEHATRDKYVHAHVWRKHDLVMWDNRVTMHRGRRFPADQARDMRRTTISDAAPTLAQAV